MAASSAESSFCIIDHTADLALEIQAVDLAAFFRQALRGMAELILPAASDPPPPGFSQILELELDAPDAEVLLVDMLNRVNLESSLANTVFRELEIDEVSARKMRGRARGYVTDQRFDIDIKAVTYHGLEIKKLENGRFSGQILFDI